MEFANDPEINCVFCGLGFSSVENVELHIVNNHQSNSTDHPENRKMFVSNDDRTNESTQHQSNVRNSEKQTLKNGFTQGSIDCSNQNVKVSRIKGHIKINQRKYLTGIVHKNSSHNTLSDVQSKHSRKRRFHRLVLKHQCRKCLKKFLFHSTLLLHVHNHQYDSKCRFPCDKCGFKYSTKRILLRHSLKGCLLSQIPDIKPNKKTKSGSCEYCHRTFISRTYLAMHQRRVCRLASQFHNHTDNVTDDTRQPHNRHLLRPEAGDQIMSQMTAAAKCDRISSIDGKSKDDIIKDEVIESHSSEMLSVQGSLTSGDQKYQSSSPDISLKDSISPVPIENDGQQKSEVTDESNKDTAQHYRWHDYSSKGGQKPFQCEICKKHFSNRSSLSNHIKSHYSSRGQPFICRDCNQRFVNLITLQDHRREICSHKTSDSKSPIDDDIKCKLKPTYSLSNFNGVSQVPLWPNTTQTNPVNQPVTCVHCNGVFYDRLELEEHALIKHSDEHGNILCLLCERTFTTNMALRVHLTKSHGFANGGCPGVSQNLPPMPRLDTNYNISDDIPHRKRRRRLFEYDKEYNCENCNRNFSTGQALGNHRRACMNMPNDQITPDNKPSSGSQNSKLHSIESLIFDNKNIRSASFNDDKNVFLAFH